MMMKTTGRRRRRKSIHVLFHNLRPLLPPVCHLLSVIFGIHILFVIALPILPKCREAGVTTMRRGRWQGGQWGDLTHDARAFDGIVAPLVAVVVFLVVPPDIKRLRGSTRTTAGVTRQGTMGVQWNTTI
jgi:hypothetical protein